jgi:hypothetical protein
VLQSRCTESFFPRRYSITCVNNRVNEYAPLLYESRKYLDCHLEFGSLVYIEQGLITGNKIKFDLEGHNIKRKGWAEMRKRSDFTEETEKSAFSITIV